MMRFAVRMRRKASGGAVHGSGAGLCSACRIAASRASGSGGGAPSVQVRIHPLAMRCWYERPMRQVSSSTRTGRSAGGPPISYKRIMSKPSSSHSSTSSRAHCSTKPSQSPSAMRSMR